MMFLLMFGRGFHSASQRVSGEFASGHCEAASVTVATLALKRRDVKAGQLDFLCRLRTFCAGLLFVQFLCKAAHRHQIEKQASH